MCLNVTNKHKLYIKTNPGPGVSGIEESKYRMNYMHQVFF